MASRARAAWSALGAVTPTKSPSLTTVTPGRAAAGPASADPRVAPVAGGRSTLPWSIPSRLMSETNRWRPVTSSRPFTFGIELPAVGEGAEAGFPARRRVHDLALLDG